MLQLLVLAASISLVQPKRQVSYEVFHAGYAAAHVTRLHRHDHRGVKEHLQAERKWVDTSRSEASSSLVQKLGHVQLSHNATVKKHFETTQSSFLQMSNKQVEALMRHHEAVLLKETRTEVGVSQGLRYRDFKRPLKGQPAITELRGLGSQYIGPLGVGSELQPQGCQVSSSASLMYMGPSDSSLSEEEKRTCHVTDQTEVWVVFDTGSTNIWVNSILCKQGSCAKPDRQQYDNNKSRSFKSFPNGEYLEIEFGTGKISGPRVVDDFHIGPFTVFNQTFGMIEKVEGQVFDEVPIDGILGLAFPAMSASGAMPFFDTIVREKVLDNNEFSFYFSLELTAANAIFWGGVDQAFYNGQIEYFNVIEPYYWAVHLLAFKVGAANLLPLLLLKEDADSSIDDAHAGVPFSGETQFKAIFDTGTTFFTAEGKLFPELMRRLPKAPCSSITAQNYPDITFTLVNSVGEPRDIVLTNKQYMLSSGPEETCSLAFMKINVPPEHGPAMVLGEVFQRHYFTVFDRGNSVDDQARIGLAPARHGPETEERLKALTKDQPSFDPVRLTSSR
jgi:hypothetical protein